MFLFSALIAASSLRAAVFTPGEFEVTESGSASYTIPIQVTPGTGGMQPKLAISYDSRGSNGLLGAGWSLSGFSGISRCSRTIAQDGAWGGVNYSADDRYCLDGNRLIATSGNYGADGTQYRTESESFAKIVSYGSAGTGPERFRVWSKDGLVHEYGYTSDSRIEAQGKTSVWVYALNKVIDTKGNTMTITYQEDNANGDFRPDRIDYGGNATAGLNPYASIQFTYEDRSDNQGTFAGGSIIRVMKRLTAIKAFVGSNLIKEYRVAYAIGGGQNLSRITSITECDGAGNCLLPTTTTWQNSSGSVGFGGGTWTAGNARLGVMGDINGDGRDDYVYAVCSTSSGGTCPLSMQLSSGTGFGSATSLGINAPILNSICTNPGYNGTCNGYTKIVGTVTLGDVNGDGRADLVVGGNVYHSTGSGFSNAGYSVTVANAGLLGDVNGDGRADFVYATCSGNGSCPLRMQLSNGNGFAAPINLDINAVNDAYCVSPGYNGSCNGYIYVFRPLSLGDINGDGRADLLTGGIGYNSTGTGFSASYQLAPPFTEHWAGVLSDIDGDGRADYVYAKCASNNGGACSLYMITSYGVGFTQPTSLGINAAVAASFCAIPGENNCAAWIRFFGPLALGDANGDGSADLIAGNSLRLSTQIQPDLLTGIHQGLNASITVTYRALSYPGTYTFESGSSYPIRDVLAVAPITVVTQVNSSNGLGGVTTNTTTYGGGKVDISGHGFLGFRWVETTDAVGAKIRTEYNQRFPYAGLPKTTTKRSSTGLLVNQSDGAYSFNDFAGANPACPANATDPSPLPSGSTAGKRYFVYGCVSLDRSWELNGTALPSTRTRTSVDAWGNATQIKVETLEGGVVTHTKTTDNLYLSPDTTNWILGRLRRAQVTSVTP
ncbi:MAG: VCBS repeat-containing protein [Burkholderiales bacterium]|nr:VCBS repeat-containing protein [Burkholderiales bacterium]